VKPAPDRHRWFFGFGEADRFCRTLGASHGWTIREHGALIGPRRGRIEGLLRRWPNLLAPSYQVWLQRGQDPPAR
jgi:hypothetical protein